MTTVRAANVEDAGAWLTMRRTLWPEGSESEHREEIERYFADDTSSRPSEVLVAVDHEGRLVGFVELAIRPYAEGCLTDRVAYLEGWFVEEARRATGVGRALVRAAEDWGRAQGCSEFGSDADPANEVSIAAHRAAGFSDAGLIRCFRKSL